MPECVDMEENIKQKPSLIEMAKKRRHIHLLEKLHRGKSASPTLSKSEIKELEKYENDPNSPGVVDSQEKVAKVFGVSTRTVAYWTRDGMPTTPQGKYDLLEIRAWRTLKKQKKGQSVKKDSLEVWDARFREYKARLAEIALKKASGELVSRAQVEKDLIHISLTVKRAFLALPRQLAPQLIGLEARQIESILASRVKEIISAFADGQIFIKEKKGRKKNAKAVGTSENLE